MRAGQKSVQQGPTAADNVRGVDVYVDFFNPTRQRDALYKTEQPRSISSIRSRYFEITQIFKMAQVHHIFYRCYYSAALDRRGSLWVLTTTIVNIQSKPFDGRCGQVYDLLTIVDFIVVMNRRVEKT